MLAIATFPTKALPLAAGSCGAAASDHPHEPQGHPQVHLDLLMLFCPLAPPPVTNLAGFQPDATAPCPRDLIAID